MNREITENGSAFLKKIVTNGLDYIPPACNIYDERAFLNAIMGYFIRNWGKPAPATDDGSAEKGNECTEAEGLSRFNVAMPPRPFTTPPSSHVVAFIFSSQLSSYISKWENHNCGLIRSRFSYKISQQGDNPLYPPPNILQRMEYALRTEKKKKTQGCFPIFSPIYLS